MGCSVFVFCGILLLFFVTMPQYSTNETRHWNTHTRATRSHKGIHVEVTRQSNTKSHFEA